MSYKAKTEVAAYRGGALTTPQEPPQRLRYPCFADQCPMPGTIFGGTTGTKDEAGTCGWHYGILPSDIPKVTRVLLDWRCVSFEINEARRVLTGEKAADPKGLQTAFENAWERLKPACGSTWEAELRPGPARTSRGEIRPFAEDYSAWAKRLERFIGSRVAEVLTTHQRRSA
jgi:hypothetical protein